MEQRFDNLTDEEIEEGINKLVDPRSRKKRIIAILIALGLISILVIGYEIAPNFLNNPDGYFLKWIRR